MSLELVLIHHQKKGTETFQLIGTEKHIRKHIVCINQTPVMLSPLVSQKYAVSPSSSRKPMSWLPWPTPFPRRVQMAGVCFQLHAGQNPVTSAGLYNGRKA